MAKSTRKAKKKPSKTKTSKARKASRESSRPAAFGPGPGKPNPFAKHTPASEWDRLWHAYVLANKSGSLHEQIRAGRALLRFDRIHGTPQLLHVAEKLREAKDLLARHTEAFKEAKKLEREIKMAERAVKRRDRSRRPRTAPKRSSRL